MILKPCPHCGDIDVYVMRSEIANATIYYGDCDNCTNVGKNEDEAAALWNTRHYPKCGTCKHADREPDSNGRWWCPVIDAFHDKIAFGCIHHEPKETDKP